MSDGLLITACIHMINFRKRHFLSQLTGLAVCSVANGVQARVTPSQSLGPFYPIKLPLDSNADLTFVEGKKGTASGHIVNLSGQVFSENGGFVPRALIEIWQCDAFGAYHHPRDGGGLDPFFQGYGKAITDDEGRYRFRTIKPVAYPGRAPHIHLRISSNSKELITQIYVRGNRENQNDFLLNSISDETARQSLIIPFEKDSMDASDELIAIFNPVIA